MKIQFLGAARTVTGSQHLITTEQNTKFLLDCGFFQGKGQESFEMNKTFQFEPNSLDFLILSHAHIDHSGNLPNLVKQGFIGKIYATPATIDLCEIMLKDSARIQEADVKYKNKKRLKNHQSALNPIYTEKDVEACLNLLTAVPYNQKHTINEEISLIFTDTGHILGSAAVNLEIKEAGKIKKICFTGDIGRYNSAILRDPQVFPQCEILISESTYGDRLHSDNSMSEKELFDVIHHTCVVKKGKLIIPAFSLGRTQEIVYALDKLESKDLLPKINVYVDSPMSINATDVMRKHAECFNESMLDYLKLETDPFGFDKLHYIREIEDSKILNTIDESCIIISSSGMIEAGRIKHHVANSVENPKNTILIVGYAEKSSIGGKLRDGQKTISMFGKDLQVKADVKVIDSYSAHADYEEMLQFFQCLEKSKVDKVFLVHGEYETQQNFKEKLTQVGFKNIEIPNFKQEFTL